MIRLELLLIHEQPDILCISEHWCSTEKINYMSLQSQGYDIISHYCRTSHIHGGCIIYAKSDIRASPVKMDYISEEMCCEICAIWFVCNGRKICVISVYRPPSGSIENFLCRLSDVLELCSKLYAELFVCGDLNIDYLTDSHNKKLLDEVLTSYNLKTTSMVPTRIFINKLGQISSTKVDYILSTVESEFCNSCVYDAHFSDHRVFNLECFLFSPNSNGLKNKKHKFYRDMSNQNLDKFKDALKSANFDSIYQCPNVNYALDSFLHIFNHNLNIYCPTKKHSNKPNSKNWITTEVKQASINLKNLYWLCRNTDVAAYMKLYRESKNAYNKLVKHTKLHYHEQLINKSENKIKTIWNLVNKETGRIKINRDVALTIDGEVFSDPTVVANIFAQHFSQVTGTNLKQYFAYSMSTSCTTSNILNKTFFFKPVSPEEVTDVISNLKNKSSTGIDNISIKTLKLCSIEIAPQLACIINLSISSGIFPSSLKTAKIIPVHKNNDTHDVCNYRPISVLSAISKIIEKIIFNRMTDFLNLNSIFCSNQHGFRSNRSTLTAACHFFEYVYHELDKRKHVAGLFFDLSCAFDCLNIKFIESKLYNIGFRGVFLEWIIDFLSDRKIFVKINDSQSELYNINIGVPQGSVLGPLIFLLFVNDLPDHLKTDSLTIYADDTSLAVSAQTLEDLTHSTRTIAKCFVNWCNSNGLMVNITKTKFVYFHPHNLYDSYNLSFQLDNSTIITSKSTKFLGLHVDMNLRWTEHIVAVNKNMNKSYYAISRIKDTMPLNALINVYYSLVYSHLCYNVILWGNSTDSNRIFLSQKRIIRKMFDLGKLDSCKPIFREYKIMPFYCIYLYNCLIYVKNNLNTFVTNGSTHSYGTRNNNALRVFKHNTTKLESSFRYVGVKVYNHLPDELKMIPYLHLYKKRIKELLLSKCYYSVTEYLEDNLT